MWDFRSACLWGGGEREERGVSDWRLENGKWQKMVSGDGAMDIEREVERGTYDVIFQPLNAGGCSRQRYRPAAVVRNDDRWVKFARQRAVWDDGAAAALVASALGRLA